tara:strand:+ start:4874 stop:5425 length:552 start_codon:yes stop_codon:yes gene_type:complete
MAMTQCKECKHTVATSAKICPNCGAKDPGIKLIHSLAGVLALGIVVALVVSACNGGDEPTARAPSQTAAVAQAPAAKQWYQGGTLHQASGLAWQQGAYADKLATAADILAKLNNIGRLSPQIAGRISGIDDYKPLAAELVTQLDEAFAPDPDPAQNERLFANQTVASTSVMVLALMGWVQTGG